MSHLPLLRLGALVLLSLPRVAAHAADDVLTPGLSSMMETAVSAVSDAYLAKARCVGLAHARALPRIIILPGDRVSCPQVTPGGLCAGVHLSGARRRIYVSYATVNAIGHELLHDVLCQLPRRENPYGCDPHHKSAYWQLCLP